MPLDPPHAALRSVRAMSVEPFVRTAGLVGKSGEVTAKAEPSVALHLPSDLGALSPCSAIPTDCSHGVERPHVRGFDQNRPMTSFMHLALRTGTGLAMLSSLACSAPSNTTEPQAAPAAAASTPGAAVQQSL